MQSLRPKLCFDSSLTQTTGCAFIAPSEVDADGDGLDDGYDADQGGMLIIVVDTVQQRPLQDTDCDGTPD